MKHLSVFLIGIIIGFPTLCVAQDNQLKGKWSGQAVQVNASSYPVEMVIDENSYTIDYPSFKCGGKLELISKRNDVYKFKEELTYNNDASSCYVNGHIELSFDSPDILSWRLYYPTGRYRSGRMTASSKLARLQESNTYRPMDQSTAGSNVNSPLANTNPLANIVSVSLPEGQFHWKKNDIMSEDNLEERVVKIGNKLWYEHIHNVAKFRSFDKSQSMCEKGDIIGLDDWSLPSVSDFTNAHQRLSAIISEYNPTNIRTVDGKTYLNKVRPFFHTSANNRRGTAGYWTNTGQQILLSSGDLVPSHSNRSASSSDTRDGAYWLPYFKCVTSAFDVNHLYNSLHSSKFDEISGNALPMKPTLEVINLEKGEFEKTVDFEKRRKEATTSAEIKYAQEMKLYEANVANISRKANNDKHLLETSNEKKLESYEKAFRVYYGTPYLTDIKYDADSETFSYFLKSGGGFSKIIEQSVKISLAQKYKEIISTPEFSPTVIVRIENGISEIIGIEELLSPESLVADSEYEKSRGDTGKLEVFIATYPQSDKVSLARNDISRLKAEKEARAKRRREAEALAKRKAEEEARQDAYDYEHACERYYVGYVGEYERSGWLATGENFVVRYTNPDRKLVTIEATEGGNSLSYGENAELSCYDLLQGEKRAQN